MKALFTKCIYIFSAVILFFGAALKTQAQTVTEYFEGATFNTQTFTNTATGVVFDLTNQFYIQDVDTYGVDPHTPASATGYSSFYIDDFANQGHNQNNAIKTHDGSLFSVKSLYMYPSSIVDGQEPTTDGLITFVGKKGGMQQFSFTKAGIYNSVQVGLNNTNYSGFTFVDFSAGTDNSNTLIDELDVATDNSYLYVAIDNFQFAPATSNTTINSITKTGSSPTNASSVQYTATFGDPVTGLTTSNFTTTATGTLSGATVSAVSAVSASVYTITVNAISGSGNLTLNLDNATGLSPGISTALPFAGDTYAIDQTAPTLTSLVYLSGNSSFNEAKVGDVVTLTFGTDEAIQAPAVNIAGHSITATSTGGNNYSASYTMTSGDTEGRIPFSLTVTDLAGNQGVYNDIAAGDDIEFDMTVPTATVSAPSLTQIGTGGAGTVSYTVTYADANFNTSSLTTAGITLNTTGTATGSVGVTGSGTSYTVTISGITGLGTLGISVVAGNANDLAGNTDQGTGPSATFNVVSSDATLAGLKLSSGGLKPIFSSGVTSYNMSVPYSTTGITASVITNNPDAEPLIKINGAIQDGVASLNVGANTITIKVTAADGITTDTYTVTVNRAQSENAFLASISPQKGPLTPLFAPGTTSYTLNVSNSIATMTVRPVSADPNATIKVNGSTVTSGTTSNPVALTAGTQTAINVVVTAQNGHTKTYTISVTRAASANARLSAVQVGSGALKPAFTPATTTYVNGVPNVTTSTTITPTTAEPNATIMINGSPVVSGSPYTLDNLALGNNTVTIVVTAQDGSTTKTYTVTVARVQSINCFLASLSPSIEPLTPVFAPSTTSYTLAVSNAHATMTLTPVTTEPNATLTINTAPATSGTAFGPIALDVGPNTITVVVTAQDGINQRTYTITVTRDAPAGANNVYQPISMEKPITTPTLGEDGIVVHQGISPNGDGVGDFLVIDNISQYPENKLSIMNRNGQSVYEAKGYDNSSKAFDGHSNKNGQMQLPGTYFYQLDYTVNGITKHKTGFVVLKY